MKRKIEIIEQIAVIAQELSGTLKQLASRGAPAFLDAPLPEPSEEPVRPLPKTAIASGEGEPAQRVVILPPEHLGKAARLEALKEQIASCTACGLCKSRTTTVPGEGSPNARVVLVGEAPGKEEDQAGRPFVGPSGKLLSKMLAAIRLAREDLFITNVVKCRPPGNREPSSDEAVACRVFLNAQLEILKPEIIVCLGRQATYSFLNVTDPIGVLRQKMQRVSSCDVLVSYHPSHLLRNPSRKAEVWADMLMLANVMASRGLTKPLPAPWWTRA